MGVYANGRLVQHQHFGFVDDGLSDADALAEAFGELADVRLAVVAQTADVNDVVQARAYLRAGHSAQRSHVLQIVGDRHVGVEGHRFRQVAHAAAHFQGLFHHVVAVQRHRAAGGRQEAGQDAHGGGLACAVWPQEA